MHKHGQLPPYPELVGGRGGGEGYTLYLCLCARPSIVLWLVAESQYDMGVYQVVIHLTKLCYGYVIVAALKSLE